MKISLISPILFDLGCNTIAPLLKSRGHSVDILFTPDLLENSSSPLSEKSMKTIIDFVGKSNLIGINGFSENYYRTSYLVDFIKKSTGITVVWGGIHATLRPRDCLEHADIVCVGEGEEAMVELADSLEAGEERKDIANLCFRSRGTAPENIKMRQPVNLNSLLPLDYDLKTQYILEKRSVRNLREADYNGVFRIYSSRGCPFRCTYCCNANVSGIYAKDGHRYCRQRDVDNIIDELKKIKKRFLSCKAIWFIDADFFSGKTQERFEDLAAKYKDEIDIPFWLWANPINVNEKNISVLKSAGLISVSIGTVEGNEEIEKGVYNRTTNADLYLSRGEILKKYDIHTEYDVILCNPYKNDRHLVNTARLLMKLPKPFKTIVVSLTYFPETELYKTALKDGIIKDDKQVQSYTKASYRVWKFDRQSAYMNVVLSLMRDNARKSRRLGAVIYGVLPEPLLKFLIKERTINFFNNLPFRGFIFHSIGWIALAAYGVVNNARYLKKRASGILNTFKAGS